jgi:hypothetical protein
MTLIVSTELNWFQFPSGSIEMLKNKTVLGLERGALSLVSITEELLDRKVASPV